MADRNLTAILYRKKDLRLESTHIPEPGPGQVQVRIHHVGICGTDLHLYEDGRIGDIKVKEPLAIGHESAGVVSKLGEGVTSLNVGDKVALESIFGCMACSDCKKGKYNLCEDAKICGVPPHSGSMTRYYVHNAADCYKLPDHVSTEEGALMEPLSVAIHSCRRAGVCLGSKVLVLGDGPLGVMTVLAAKANGATHVGITGKHDFRLSIARKLGADFVFNVTSKEPKEVTKMVIDAFGGKPEISIESIGAQSSFQAAVSATHNGGNVTIIGLRENVVSQPIVNAIFREIDIRGVAVNAHCYPIALAMVSSGQVNLKALVTDTFTLDNVNEAFKKAESKEGMKIMIKCTKD